MMNILRRGWFSPRRPARRARRLFALTMAALGSISPIMMGVAAPQHAAQAPPQPPAPGGAPAPAAPLDRNAVLILVRSTLLALHHGNETGNYTVLRDLGAPGFQAVNSAARLGKIFASLRNQGADLTSLAVLEPQITKGPEIGKDGLLRLGGFFSSGGRQLNFELAFQPVNGRLKLFGISTSLSQPGALATVNPADAAKDMAAPPASGAKPDAAQAPAAPAGGRGR